MDAVECLKTRRSTRSYSTGPVPQQVLEDIVDCGRLAASGNNVQPWRFVVVTDEVTRAELSRIAEYGKFIADAGACVAVFCEDTKYYIEDGSAATQNILNAAHAHGLGACWVAGDKKPYAAVVASLLGAPKTFKLVSLVAVGWPVAPSNPQKRTLAEVLDWERFEAR